MRHRLEPERLQVPLINGLHAVLIALLVLSNGAGMAAGHAREHRHPRLVGDLTVVAEASGHVRISLPSAQKLREGQGAVKVDGDGRFIGLILDRVVDGSDRNSAVTLTVSSFGHCVAPGCRPQGTRDTFSYSEGTNNGSLPAGIYDLYIVADDSTARVRLDFAGTDAETVLDSGWSDARAKILTVRDAALPALDSVFSGGQRINYSGDGMLFFEVWFKQSFGSAGAVGTCLYWEDPPATGAYLPGCDGPDDGRVALGPAAHPSLTSASVSSRPLPSAVGGWFVAPAPPTTGAATLAMVLFEP